MLEKAADIFSPPHCKYIEEEASHNILANVEKLICKSLVIVQIEPSHSDYTLLGIHKDLHRLPKHSMFMDIYNVQPMTIGSHSQKSLFNFIQLSIIYGSDNVDIDI